MQSNPHKLTVIDGETLMDKRLPPTKFCVDTLLPQGLCILGGSPKVGKSWLVLDLCVHVAQGTPLWGLDVTRGDVLYLCLEDSERRIQERLNTITDNVPDGMYFATGCTSIESGVCDWLRDFKRQHPEVSLIAIDTFQLIRTPTPEVSCEGRFTPPVEDHQLDKMTVMMLEAMGIKVEPKALLQYSANNEYDNEYGLYM